MLAHERRGSGPPVVLIHGLGSRRQVWDPLLAELTRHREVIALDLPGFGESPLWTPPAAASDNAGAAPGPTWAEGAGESGGRDSASESAKSGPRSAAHPTRSGPRSPVGPMDSGLGSPVGPAQTRPGSHAGPAQPGSPGTSGGRMTSGEPASPASFATPAVPGTSGGARVPGSVDHLADVVAAFLDELGLDRPELAGSSLGGGIALELGRRGRAAAVTAFAPIGFWGPAGRRWCQTVVGGARALSTALDPALPRIFATRAGRVALCGIFYGRPARLSPDDCLSSARALSRAPGFAAARSAFGVWRLPVGADPGALSGIPVTVAWGTRDAVLPYRRQATRARDELPAARHVLLPGCGHLPFTDDPARCVELLTVRQ